MQIFRVTEEWAWRRTGWAAGGSKKKEMEEGAFACAQAAAARREGEGGARK